MGEITNNTVRLIQIGGYLCVPGQTTEVPDQLLVNARIDELMADGSLSAGAAPPPPNGEEESKRLNTPVPNAVGQRLKSDQELDADQKRLQERRLQERQTPVTPPQRIAQQPSIMRTQSPQAKPPEQPKA